jgi:hypothetical protein
MSIINILSIVFFIFTFYLLIKKRIYGKAVLYFGGLTYIFVILYTFLPYINPSFKSIGLFVYFSLLLILFGLFCGSIAFIIKKDTNLSQIVAIIASSLLMLILFNITGLLSYIYVPVLMYVIQLKFNESLTTIIN